MTNWKKPINQQIIKVMGINFFGNFGSNMFSFGSGLYILHRTGSALGFGGSLIIGPLVGLLLMPLLGYLVDHYNHRQILWWSQISAIVALSGFAVALFRWPNAYYGELLVLLVLLKMADMTLTTTLTASIIQLVPKSHLQQLNSLNQSATSLATIASPLLGAVLYSSLPFAWFSMVEVVAELAAIGLVAITNFNFNQQKATSSTTDGVLKNLLGGLHYVKSQPLILLIVTMSALTNFFFAALNVGLPYLMINIVHLSNTQYSWTETAFAVGMLGASLTFSRLVFKIHPVYLTIQGLFGFGGVMISFILPGLLAWPKLTSLVFFILINLLSGVLVVLINTPQMTFMQQMIPSELQGRVFALVTTIAQLLMPLGTLVYSLLFNRQTPGIVFAVSGCLLIVLMIFDSLSMHRALTQQAVIDGRAH